MVQFKIHSKLPSLNDYINLLKSPNGKYTGSKFKSTTDEIICYQIDREMKRRLKEQLQKPSLFYFEWHEKEKRRDIDNVYSAHKYILDALQKLGILKNDNPQWVRGIWDSIKYNSHENEYVKITVYGLDELEHLKQVLVEDVERYSSCV